MHGRDADVTLRNDLIQGVGDNSSGAGPFEAGDELALLFFLENDFDGDPGGIREAAHQHLFGAGTGRFECRSAITSNDRQRCAR